MEFILSGAVEISAVYLIILMDKTTLENRDSFIYSMKSNMG